jgi:predicted outer membrane repeat protein
MRPNLINCMFLANTGTYGGAVGNVSSSPVLTNCTIVSNVASYGGGLYSSTTSSVPVITNSIFWGNSASSGNSSQIHGTAAVVNYSCVQGGWGSGNGNLGSDPQFLDAAGPDGLPGTPDDNLHLAGGSPCINSGDDAAVAGIATDLDGNPRISSGTVDVGAYEQPVIVAPARVGVPEGGTAQFTIALADPPGTPITVTVAVDSGDADISVLSGGTLVFDSSNYATPQTVTLAAAIDADYASGTTALSIGRLGSTPLPVTAYEIEGNASANIHVNSAASLGGDGRAWESAFQTVQEAIDAAWASRGAVTEIWVAAGTYRPSKRTNPTDPRSASCVLFNALKLYGGFAGHEDSRDQRDPDTLVTVLSGDLNGDDGANFANNADNCYHVVSASGVDNSTTLDGFTITAGNANSTGVVGGYMGGGVYAPTGSLSLTHCIVRDNFATGQDPSAFCGAGFYTTDSSPVLTHCSFIHNSGATSAGAGVYCSKGAPVLTECSFQQNSGGGYYSGGSNSVLTACEFLSNTATCGAGASFVGGTCTLTDCTFQTNVSTSTSSGGGGGMRSCNGDAKLTSCRFISNTSKGGAGGLSVEAFSSGDISRVTALNCTFTGNLGTTGGGAGMGYGTYVNCFFESNTAQSGGGLYAGPTTITNCTFRNNVANGLVGYGGGLYNANGQTTATNCVFWGNSSRGLYGYDSQIYQTGTLLSVSYSCVQFGWQGAGNISLDPQLLPGGSLRYGSPCVDAGNSSAVPAGTTNDLAGHSRFTDDPETPDTGAQGGASGVVDMGVFEYQPLPARRLYVNGSMPGGGTGESWGSACQFVQDALAAAQLDAGVTEIWVAAGTYQPDRDAAHPTGSGDRSATFQPLSGVTLYGGFPGQPGQEGDASLRNPCGYPTTLSGDLAGNDGPTFTNNAENSYHVVTASVVGARAVLDGFSITGGNANGASPNNYGGGLYTLASNARIVNCTFTNNSGSALYTRTGSPTVANCVVAANSGYGLYNVYSDYSASNNPSMVNCTVIYNSGGGISSSMNSVTLTNTIVWGNGGIQLLGSATATYSCVPMTGTGNINADPRIMRNGYLRPGSPCIDAGDNTAVLASLTIDVSGHSRFVDDFASPDTGNPGSPPGAVVDIGAHEYQPVTARRLYVKGSAAVGGSGVSWSTAYRYLQDALRAASSDPSVVAIWVSGGTYLPDHDSEHPSGTGDRTAAFQLVEGVGVYGSFPGEPGQEDDLSVRNPATYLTTLSGDLAGNDTATSANNGENSYHVLTANAVGPSAVLDGVTVRAGNANGSTDPTNAGAGIYNTGGSPTLTSCRFTGNAAVSGGVVHNAGGGPVLVNCMLLGNAGTALRNVSSSPVLINCTLTGNASWGIASSSGNLTMTNTIVWGNAGTQISLSGTSIVATYSCTGSKGIGSNSDPMLLTDGRLRRGSPCIDSGDNMVLPPGLNLDSAGRPRLIDDPATPDSGNPGSPPRAAVDIGACEYQPLAANRLYVGPGAPPGGNGQSWATAYQFLQDALLAAQNDPGVTEIWVAGGTYPPDRDSGHPTGTRDRNAMFQLLGGVSLYGGFPGQPGQENDLSVRNAANYPTILSGDLAGNDGPSFINNGENSYHVLSGTNSGASAVLDGFTVSAGNASGASSPTNYGGGVYNLNGAPTLRACRFLANSASSSGGGMYSSSGGPILVSCTFSENSSKYGAGLYSYYGGEQLTSCIFSGNTAVAGGGLYAVGANLSLTKCAFDQNSASSDGGGAIYASSGTISATQCTLSGNVASTYGGGLYCNGAMPTVAGCLFSHNSSKYGGGLADVSSGCAPLVTNCVFDGNSASSYGGGLYNSYSCLLLSNSTFSKNSSPLNAGGGLYDSYGNTPTVTNCILFGNIGSQISEAYSGRVNVTYSCVQGGRSGTGNIIADPLFVSAASGNLRLRGGSPCIDAGKNAAVPVGITTDLDGLPRLADDPCTPDCPTVPGSCGTAPIVDMGAYEYASAGTSDLDHDGTATAADFDRFLMSFGRSCGSASFNPEADFDRDGQVTLVDYQLWLQQYRAAVGNPETPAPLEVLGDFQRDGHVDALDLQHMQACPCGDNVPVTNPACLDADLDGDSDVDQDDFGLFQRCFSGSSAIDLACKY